MTRRIALYNNKGGVAKTTSVINLAYSIQKTGQRVLVVDCDSQANCFSFFLTEGQNEGVILPTEYETIRHTTWKRYTELEDTQQTDFDYVLFDLPPAMTEEVKQIIRHCGMIFVPTMLGEFEIQGLQKVTEEIARQDARLGGIFITMYQKQNDAELLHEFHDVLKTRLMQTVIPYSRTVRESQKAGLAIEEYFIEKKVPRNGSSWKIVTAYESLATEIITGSKED